MHKINQNHYKVLKIVFEQKEHTPYYGILADTGYWPYSYIIIYKRMMYFHHLIHSDERRITRRILVNQIKGKGKGKTFYMGVEKWLDKFGLPKNEKEITEITKSKWKKIVKEKIDEIVKEVIEEKRKTMKKLRFITRHGKQEYVEKFKMEKVREIMKMRLNMAELKANYRGKYKDTLCPACRIEEETTEHALECSEYKRLVKHTKRRKKAN